MHTTASPGNCGSSSRELQRSGATLGARWAVDLRPCGPLPAPVDRTAAAGMQGHAPPHIPPPPGADSRQQPRRSSAAAAAACRRALAAALPNSSARAKRKGMSLEEKRQTLLGIFHESKDVFVLKARRRRRAWAERRQCWVAAVGRVRQCANQPASATNQPPNQLTAGGGEAGLQARRGAAVDQGGAAGATWVLGGAGQCRGDVGAGQNRSLPTPLLALV